MHFWKHLLRVSSYEFEHDFVNGSQEIYRPFGEFSSTVTAKESRRFPVQLDINDGPEKPIPVISKTVEEERQIEKAIQKDDFLGKKIVGKRLRKVVGAMYLETIKAEHKIIQQGDLGKHMYIVAEGEFEVTKQGIGIVAKIGVGTVFGELAILFTDRRQATVTAVVPSKVWVLDREHYQTIVKQSKVEEKLERLNFLKESPILKKTNEETLSKVAELLQDEYFQSGETIIRQGDPPDKFYIITAGSVTVQKLEDGLIGHLYKGNCFGERALLSESTRQATIIAGETGVQCLTLSRQHFINHFGNIQDITTLSIPETPKNIKQQTSQPVEKYKKLKLSDFKRIQTIGEGGFGRVEFIQHKRDHALTFALKFVKRVEMIENKQIKHLIDEKEIQMSCDSPFIVKLYKTDKDSRFLYFFLEPCLGGEVYKWMHREKHGRFDNRTARFITSCFLEALLYLHDRETIYRDLKPENLLVDHKGYVKLADFGFAKKLGPYERTSTFAGTPEYLAPEIIDFRDYDRAVDFWTLGVLIFELLNGQSPFASFDDDRSKVFRNISRGFDRLRLPDHMDLEALHLIKSLLRHNPEERFGYSGGGLRKVRTHRWFDEFDWTALREKTMISPIQPRIKHNVDCRYMKIVTGEPSIPEADYSNLFDDF